MATLDPGASPHPPHRHSEEEILIVADGTVRTLVALKRVATFAPKRNSAAATDFRTPP